MRGFLVGSAAWLFCLAGTVGDREVPMGTPATAAPSSAKLADPALLAERWRAILASARAHDTEAVRAQVSAFALSSDEIRELLRDDVSPFLQMHLDMCCMPLRWVVAPEALRGLEYLEGEVTVRATAETAVSLPDILSWNQLHRPVELSELFRRVPTLHAVELRTSSGDVTPILSGFFWSGERWRLLSLDARWPLGMEEVWRTAESEIKSLRESVRRFREAQGALPRDMDELVRAGFVAHVTPDGRVLDPWGRPYEYVLSPQKDGFALRSLGVDPVSTYDDIDSRRLRD